MYPGSSGYGIYIFPVDAVVGESAIKALGLEDVVFEYEVTSNRVDCYSVIGIASGSCRYIPEGVPSAGRK